jgi:FixJ family two-component response regulator
MIVANAADCDMSKSNHRSPLPIVYVVDGDVAVRKSLENLIRLEDCQPETFASTGEFLSWSRTCVPSCLVLDATLPNPCSLEVQRQVAGERPDMPILFITDRSDIALTVQAMKAGAAEFLMKPLDTQALVSTLRSGIARSAAALDHEFGLRALRERYMKLSLREQQVMALVVAGRLNKQIGGILGISEITVKAHRGKVMRKLGADTLVDLVYMAALLRRAPSRTARDLLSGNRRGVDDEPRAGTISASFELERIASTIH